MVLMSGRDFRESCNINYFLLLAVTLGTTVFIKLDEFR